MKQVTSSTIPNFIFSQISFISYGNLWADRFFFSKAKNHKIFLTLYRIGFFFARVLREIIRVGGRTETAICKLKKMGQYGII